jgi:hypothetical protein
MTLQTARGNTAGRILGVVLLVVGIIGVIVSIVGIIAGIQVVNAVGSTANYMLSLTVDGLDTAAVTLEQVQTGVVQVQDGLTVAEETIVSTGNTISESDETLTGILRTVSQDVPDTLDSVQAAVPPAAEAAKSLLENVEDAMVSASDLVGQGGPQVNEMFRVVSQDVPDTLDYWSAAVPANAEAAHRSLGNLEAALVSSDETMQQVDAAWQQGVRFASEDLPNTIDFWNSGIPPNLELARAYLNSAEAALLNASEMAHQADVTLDQAVRVASHDVPSAIDAWNGVIPANAAVLKAYVDAAGATLENSSEMARQADASLDQTVKIASHDLPDAIDAWNSVIPANAQLAKAYAGSAEAALANASAVAGQADVALDQVVKVASQDVPNTIDAWNAVIPINAGLWRAYLDAAGAALENAGEMARQADVALDQAVRVASHDMPNTIDYWSAAIPANAQLAKAYLTSAEAALENASQMVTDADTTLDQTVVVATKNVPDTLDAVQGSVPVTAEAIQAVLTNLRNTMDWTSLGVDQTRTALDLTTQLVQSNLDQLDANVSPTVAATEAQVNNVLALLRQLQYLDATYRVQLDQAAEQLSTNLDYMSLLLDATDANVDVNLDALDQGLAALSYNVDLVDRQVEQYVAMGEQLKLVSDQLRGLEPVYRANVDLEPASQYLLAVAQYTAAMEPQIDQLVAMSGQLDEVSRQLRGLEGVYNGSVDLAVVGQYVSAMSQNAEVLNTQIGQLAEISSLQLEATSQQLRSLEPLYNSNVDLEALSLYLLALSQNAAAIDTQIDQLADMSSLQLEATSQQLRSLEPLYNSNVDLEALSLYLLALSQNTATLNPQIDQIAGMTSLQLEATSQQLRSLEPLYESNIDLGAASQMLESLAQNVASANSQLDQVAAMSGQIEQMSEQLRRLEVYSNVTFGVGEVGEEISLISQYIGLADQQIDQLAATAGVLDQWSGALRTLAPYANIDYAAISGQILDLSGNLPTVRGQIDQLVDMSGQLEQLSGALRSLAPYAETDFKSIGQDVSNLSTNVSNVSTQLDQFVAMTDEFKVTVDNTKANISQIQATLDSRLNLVKIGIVIFMIWILLAQLAPLYLGWVLVSRRIHFVATEI